VTARGWVPAPSLRDFQRGTIPALASDASGNNLLLTVVDRLHSDGLHAFGERDPELLTWYAGDGAVEAAVVRTPPYSYILDGTPTDESVRALVELLLDPGGRHDGREINLPAGCEAALTREWTAHTGTAPRVLERNRLYRLEQALEPDPRPAGHARVADARDIPAVARFLAEFWATVGRSAPRDAATTARRVAAARIGEGNFVVWADETGEPVSSAGTTPIVARTGRIGPVYTPEHLRGRGYGGGVTAAAGRVLIERGAEQVLLFTDLANATSNALYQRIGYRPVGDRVRIALEGAAAAAPGRLTDS
jgi:RimJ/RimL family protein N-acetyltransferase